MFNRIPVLVIVLASLASTLSAPAADVKQPPRNVAVVALFDNTFHKLKFGLTVFDNDFQSKDVSAWHVAEQAESDMVALLKQKGIGQSVGVLAQAGARATAGENQHGVEAPLIEAARNAGFDTLILVRPARDQGNQSVFTPGFGIAAWGKLFGPRPACPYAVFHVQIYRTADAKGIDRADGYSWGEGPCVDMKSVPWQDDINAYSDAEWSTIQAAIHKRINEGMARALRHLDFE
jgi:hypothetical protein